MSWEEEEEKEVEVKPAPGDWTRYYSVIEFNATERPGHDQVLRVAPNSVCVLSLATTHSVFDGRSPTELIFDQDLHVDFTGKKKKGAMQLQPTSPICRIKCSDDSTFFVYCGIRSKLLECNDALVGPNAMPLTPQTYIAIFKAEPRDVQRLRTSLPHDPPA
ncbi:hypothetical protein CTAYLR_005131 [Chrysophaeum taylorii]|uniref:Protein Abitram n=1 Tax=Chrysophaeum taylorii TaxID=2483200 RepID=A0AAD7UDW5_9STRA|nr:hypothetical protein CTAYLR_005131 [Chrysophaeum taylorii]